ncbi:tail fiber domain-containing protein [Salibaculum sp.]|uniref:tail fiber domain-containing protein n=1 Tax=Salibaculum sp. TaxID=2855480 RepID=UPI002B46B85F|nr:tail fiber domain-containing protein [Salibaculum sp.]HKL70815.1 tail fiber domain-containing protein [Salibaculum sp.]
MKTFICAASIATLTATTTLAGGMAPAIEMEPVEVVEETGGSSANLIVPLILIALIAAASSSSDSGLPPAASDMRLKDNITPVGTAANGLPLYQFTYRGSDIVFEGVMAQDVLSHRPEAVTTLPGGVMAVDYGLLGIEMKRVN